MTYMHEQEQLQASSTLLDNELEWLNESEDELEWLSEFETELETEINRSSKTYVRWLQQQLNRIESAGLSTDGKMGSSTRNAIRAFQKKYGVTYPPNGKPSKTLDAFLIMFGASPPPGTPEPTRFNPHNLPSAVYAAFKQGASAWKIVLQRSLDSGITDVNKLADIMFFLAHPERRGRQIHSSEIKAIREWNNWRNRIRPILDARRAASKAQDLIELLKQVSVNKLGRSPSERLSLQRLQIFLTRALSGERVDDRYWQFTILDGFGRERSCQFTGTIASVKRGKRPQHAVANFKRSCATARNVQEVGRCLKNIHDTILCHINALIGWAHHNSALGDAALRDFSECAWLLELQAASQRTSPKSIYSCFAPLLHNVHKVCT